MAELYLSFMNYKGVEYAIRARSGRGAIRAEVHAKLDRLEQALAELEAVRAKMLAEIDELRQSMSRDVGTLKQRYYDALCELELARKELNETREVLSQLRAATLARERAEAAERGNALLQ